MSVNYTKSNTIATSTIYTLNDKQSNLKTGLKENLNLDFSNIVTFINGTHLDLCGIGINGKEVDIVGVDKDGDIKALIEIKANLNETLQASQQKGGEYEVYSTRQGISLYYFIPKGYREDHLPNNAIIIYWDDILNIAAEYDTFFANLIVSNVPSVKNCINIKLEQLRARIWQILAQMNLNFNYNSYSIDDYRENSPFYNSISLDYYTFLSISHKGICIGKEYIRSEKQIGILINNGFQLNNFDKCYYTNIIIDFQTFMKGDVKQIISKLKEEILRVISL